MNKNSAGWQIGVGVAAVAVVLLPALVVWRALGGRLDFSGIWVYRALFVQGWGWTVGISAAGLVGALALAPVWCAARRSGWHGVRAVATGLTELIRGTPFLVIVLIGYYVLADALGAGNRVAVGIALLAVYGSAYLGEMLRGGLDSVARTQWEAARAVGFDDRQAFRWVILPQALRRILPGIAGQALILVKDSALLSAIGVMELTKQTQIASALTYSSFESFFPLAAGYLILTLPLSALARNLERRMSHEA